jgi:hypothetical protein
MRGVALITTLLPGLTVTSRTIPAAPTTATCSNATEVAVELLLKRAFLRASLAAGEHGAWAQEATEDR